MSLTGNIIANNSTKRNILEAIVQLNLNVPVLSVGQTPVQKEGSIIFDKFEGVFYVSNGEEWLGIVAVDENGDSIITINKIQNQDGTTAVITQNDLLPETIQFLAGGSERARLDSTALTMIGGTEIRGETDDPTGGDLTIRGGSGESGDSDGGCLFLFGGIPSGGGSRGCVEVRAGDGGILLETDNANSPAGDINFTAGDSTSPDQGGSISLTSGAGDTGGNISLTSGGGDTGGNITNTTGNGDIGGDVMVTTGDGSSGRGGDVTTTTGTGSGARGGNVITTTGTGSRGGSFNLTTGNGSSDRGGDINLTSGNGAGGRGGAVAITAGTSSTDEGGDITLDAGDAPSDRGGDVTITGGSGGSGRGGDIVVTSGPATGDRGGDVLVTASASTTDRGGDITLDAGGSGGNRGGDVSLITGGGTGASREGHVRFGDPAAVPGIHLDFKQAGTPSITPDAGTIVLSGGNDCCGSIISTDAIFPTTSVVITFSGRYASGSLITGVCSDYALGGAPKGPRVLTSSTTSVTIALAVGILAGQGFSYYLFGV